FNEALRIEPNYAYALTMRGTTYLQQGDQARAMADLDQSITLEPKTSGFPYQQRGILNVRSSNFDRAIADFTQSAALGADANALRGDTYVVRGSSYLKDRDDERAIADFNQALRLKPDLQAAYFERARALSQKRESARAIADYSEAIRLQPTAAAYNNRGH